MAQIWMYKVMMAFVAATIVLLLICTKYQPSSIIQAIMGDLPLFNFTDIDFNTITVIHTDHQDQIEEHNCTARIYTIPASFTNDTIFTDKELWKRCGINGHTTVQEAKAFGSPDLITKCGVSHAKLLSAKTENRPIESGFLVPNVVYYVMFGKMNLTFLEYVCIKSADKYIRPEFMFVLGDGQVFGYWWEKTLLEIPNIYHVYHPQVEFIQGQKPLAYAHQSDIVRMYTVLENGGIYLDTDMLVLKSFDPLRRQYSLTLGHHGRKELNNAVIVAAARQPLMCVWYNAYRDYDPRTPRAWGNYSMVAPYKLANLLPQYVHVERYTMYRPAWWKEGLQLLFNETMLYDWSQNYAMHIWKRGGPVPKGPEGLAGLNNTLGKVMRRVYYDKI